MTKRPAGRCVFCNRPRVTKEDIIPIWLRDALVPPPGTVQKTGAKFTPVVKMSLKGRLLCRQCNNVWLGDRIEKRAARDLKPLILGEAGTLTPSLQEFIAFWAAKTAILVEHKAGRRPSADLAHTMRIGSEAPPECVVWIAGLRTALYFSLAPYGLRAPPQHVAASRQGLFTTMAFGHVVLVVQICPEPGQRLHVRLPPASDAVLTQIYPVRTVNVAWPPTGFLNDPDEIDPLIDLIFTSLPPGWFLIPPPRQQG